MSELGDIQRAFARMCFDRAPADADLDRLHGERERWLIYRSMVRSRLFAMMRSGLPKTAALLGDERFEAAVADYLEAHTPRTRFIREVVHELVTHALPEWERDPALPHLGDLARWEDTKWRVGAMEEREAPAEELDFERPAVINPVLETLEVTHRVDKDHLAPPTLDEPHLMLVYRKPGGSRLFTYVLNDVGARLFRAWCAPDRSCADGVRAVLEGLGRDKPTPRFLEGMASVLADLVAQRVVLGSPPRL